VLDFRRLGFDTYYVEHLSGEECFDENWERACFANSANAGYFRAVMDRFGLANNAALLEWDGSGHVGLSRDELEGLAREHAATPDTYRDYIWGSRGELTAAKHGYAAGRTGWFSDRSACYLAAGRPVITQDTAIGRNVPTGAGLLTFRDLDEAVGAVEAVERDYAWHAAAAQAFAREYLDSDRVLTHLWEMVC
jgi:hypothetical protein